MNYTIKICVSIQCHAVYSTLICDHIFCPSQKHINIMSADLPRLFNSSKRRKITPQTYRAPECLRDSVYRCQEYPGGVYINKYGAVDPNQNIFELEHDTSEEDASSDANQDVSEFEDEDTRSSSGSASDSSEELNVQESVESNDADLGVSKEWWNNVSRVAEKRRKVRRILLVTQQFCEDWDGELQDIYPNLSIAFESNIFGEPPSFEIVASAPSKNVLRAALNPSTLTIQGEGRDFHNMRDICDFVLDCK